MRVLVCGGRDFATDGPNGPEYRFVITELYKLAEKYSVNKLTPDEYGNWLPSDIFIIAGKAKGVDIVAIEWAVVNWCDFKEYPAEWSKYGRSAGYVRNKQMLVEGKPDLVIAFPGGKGTAMMVKLAREAGVEVIEIKYD